MRKELWVQPTGCTNSEDMILMQAAWNRAIPNRSSMSLARTLGTTADANT